MEQNKESLGILVDCVSKRRNDTERDSHTYRVPL